MRRRRFHNLSDLSRLPGLGLDKKARQAGARVPTVGISETIATEDKFRAEWPRHAQAVFDHVKGDPALALQRWIFARAVVRRPYLATVLFECVASQGERTELWLSVAPDSEGGWSILPVLKEPLARGTRGQGTGER